ncbi:M24 family metallopeptidase [Roseateles sp. DXS20W]|uniref:M24 family metallopeptidase n=1 Tax=Pelomonas lactea TaxID=3299030 RepID=A0ABW7GEX6_9BURK
MTSFDAALSALPDLRPGVQPIQPDEYRQRLRRLQARLRAAGLQALYLHAGSSLRYFMGTPWHPSERLLGALVPADGEPLYIAPAFERDALQDRWGLPAAIHCWDEHDDPWALLARLISGLPCSGQGLALDGSLPFEFAWRLQRIAPGLPLVDGSESIASLRMRKSAAEIALLQRAFDMTLRVQQAARSVLRTGMDTREVEDFIDQAHKRVGGGGSRFCIVLFGEATSYPHGVKHAQTLADNDVVLIDCGCSVEGYASDLTRTYVHGRAGDEVRRIWAIEHEAQAAAFAAAQLGTPCEAVDDAARAVLESHGLGPGYELPGLPHRTGHGVGLDLHEHPYLVRGNSLPLEIGMCCSNEPMIVVPGAFGVRLEDHFYMTGQGPRWFTRPSPSVDFPFG